MTMESVGMESVITPSQRVATARKLGEEAGELCLRFAMAEHAFDADGAACFIFGWLARHGATAGEELVRQANLHGYRGHDNRCFGPVFKRLIRRGVIKALRSDLPRMHGHGTAGGRLYALAVAES